MRALLLAALVTLGGEPIATIPPSLRDLPPTVDLLRAEKDVEALFGEETAAAKRPADKKALAVKMFNTAMKVHDDPAGQCVLLQQARDLAIAAGDAAVALDAVHLLAGYQPAKPAGGANGAKDWLAKGHELWKAAEELRGQDQLAKRLEAAEWYFRARLGTEGLETALINGRLKSLLPEAAKPKPSLKPEEPKPGAGEAIVLTAKKADLHGKTFGLNEDGSLGSWNDPADWVSWDFTAPQGSYRIELNYSCHTPSAGSVCEVAVADQRGRQVAGSTFRVEGTGQYWKNFRDVELGQMKLRPGRYTLSIRPSTKPGGWVMNLKEVRLTPVESKP